MSKLQQHELSCDVLVAGGGPAGVPCAIAAARGGVKVILVHDRPVLGGNCSSEIRMHIVGANGARNGYELELEAREGGIIEEIRLDTCARNPQRSPSMLDLILYEKCRAEPNLTLLLNTTVVATEATGRHITHTIAERQSTEDVFRISADVFIDCTGDGRLGLEAGARFVHGREAKSEYKEPLAMDVADRKTLGSTLLYMARDHSKPMPFVAPPWARKFTEEDLKLRPHAEPGFDRGLEYGYWWVEWGGELDTLKDNETIRDELLSIVMGVWDHIKNGGDHGAENWALDWFGFVPGKRETRRFIGQHVLTEFDVKESRPFPDSIAYGGWPIDLHPPEGVDGRDLDPYVPHRVEWLYDIPLRSCVSADVGNLMFAGRNHSATHVAFASTRVMATCALMGQGAGTAAAYAVRNGLKPAELASNETALRAIRQRLLRDDCYLIDVPNGDDADLARRAQVTASSEQPNGRAADVLSGQTRSVHHERGAPPDRARPGTHRWMSDPAAGLPAWIKLKWDKPVAVGEVQITFDTGLHRFLTLSYSDDYVKKMIWGRPQPETVGDYRIEGLAAGKWQTLVEVAGNYQRLRRHRIEAPERFEAVRVTVLATNGLDHARVCEVRVYEPAAAGANAFSS